MSTKKPPSPPPQRQSSLRGRDARTGHFIPVEQARRDPSHTTVERVPLPGKGTGK